MTALSQLRNMHEVFAAIEKRNGNRTAVRYMRQKEVVEVSSPQFFEDIREVSSALIRLGLTGRHIGILGKNSYHWILMFCAITNIGSVAVLLSKDYRPEEIREAAQFTDLAALIYDHDLEEAVAEAGLPEEMLPIDMTSSQREGVYSLDQEREKGLLPVQSSPGRDALAVILFTSGTTGKSKAVMLPNRSILSAFCNYVFYDRFYSQLALLPFHHVAGFSIAVNAICLGAVLCIGESPKRIFWYLEEMKPTSLFVVPALLTAMEQRLRQATPGENPLGGNLSHILCGGAKFQPEALQTFLDWDIQIWQIYGASETCGQGTQCRMTKENIQALGEARHTLQADIWEGELVLHGDPVMLGYYKDEVGTQEVLEGGWYHTGDLCCRGNDGYYYLTGRKKNLIILSNGENVSPEELESKLRCFPKVCEVMVGEEEDFLCATFFPQYPEGSTREEKAAVRQEIAAFVQEYNREVPTYKQVNRVHFREKPFEKTAVGKLVRHTDEMG